MLHHRGRGHHTLLSTVVASCSPDFSSVWVQPLQSPRVRLWSSPTQTCGRVSLGSLTCNCSLFSVTAYSSRQWLSSLVVTGLQGVTRKQWIFFSLALESRGEAVDWLLLFWVCFLAVLVPLWELSMSVLSVSPVLSSLESHRGRLI